MGGRGVRRGGQSPGILGRKHVREGQRAGERRHACLRARLAPIGRHHLSDRSDNQTVDDQVHAPFDTYRVGERVRQRRHEDGDGGARNQHADAKSAQGQRGR